MVANLESKLLAKKPVPAPAQTSDVEVKSPVDNHEVAANEPPVKSEPLMGFMQLNPNRVFLYGIDEVPEGFDEKLLTPFADPYRLAYDDTNQGYVAYKQVLKEQGSVKKPATIVPVTCGDQTLFVANDGRQTTKIARELGFETMPVISLNETDAKTIALFTVGANTGIKDSILVLAAKAQALVDLKIPQRTIAPRFGVVQSTLNNWLKLNKASDYLKQLIVNGENGFKPGVAWTTAVQMISKKWTDEEIKAAVEPEPEEQAEGEEGGEGEEGEGGEEKETKAAPARATASSIFGSFKDDFLTVINAKGFALPESLNTAAPLELFIMGAECAFAKKTDDLPEDLRKLLNAKMALRRKAVERAAKKAAGDKLAVE